jgi:hypothetical protein
MIGVNMLVEGTIDEFVTRRLLDHVGLVAGNAYGRNGKVGLLKSLPKYNQAARFAPWFVVVDLDWDAECAPLIVNQWLPKPETGMRLRIAVRAIESWIMADFESLSIFLAVSSSKLPRLPDLDPHPKQTFVNVARTSRKKSIREDIVPRQGSGAQVGPRYTSRLIEFATQHWRPDEAMKRSDSLRRCVHALSTLTSWISSKGC